MNLMYVIYLQISQFHHKYHTNKAYMWSINTQINAQRLALKRIKW